MKNKKYNLLKVIGIAFLVFVVLSWFIPTGYYSSGTYTKGETNPVGLYGIFIGTVLFLTRISSINSFGYDYVKEKL